MAVFKCKMCGGTIEFEQGSSVGVCDSCGTKQTLPKLDDDKKSALYDRANHFRRNNEFDKAMGIYEQILNEDNTDAEAYWSLVLCRYGIEYVEDPATHKRVPTVNRTQYTSVYDDDNYKSALQYADGYQREIYEEEAKAINEIQKGILAISQKEEPFDVFICYKETDTSGRRTQDSVLANDLYHQLTQEGFKVFFSRITLEDKLGTAYEPYIFAAFNSAKVMVVLGTKPEYFNSVWVKNEWSRYLALVKQSGGKKILIPAYRDMDPYDLPEEFAHLQAQDMSKLGFMQDLIRGIKKLTESSTPQTVVKETVTVNNGGIDVETLLKRVSLFLADENWNSANEYCEKVLDIDPENGEAYFYKLMVDLKIRNETQLKNYSGLLMNNPNYNKIMQFGVTELKEQVREYELICKYNYADTTMRIQKYEEARKLFDELGDYMDSKEKSNQCTKLGEAIEAQLKQAELEAKKAEQEKRQKAILKNLKITSVFLYIILFLSFLPFLMSALGIENEGIGAVVFVLSIVALVPVGIIYIIKLISAIVNRKKLSDGLLNNVQNNKIQKYLLLLFVIAHYSFAFLSSAIYHGYIGMLSSYSIIAFLIVLIHSLVHDWKQVFQYSINIIALCSFAVGILMRRQNILVTIAVSAIISAVVLSLLYIGQGKAKNFNIKPFSKKQFIASVSAMSVVIVFFISFNIISTNKINSKIEIIQNQLSGKTFVADDTNAFRQATVFESRASYHSVYEDGDIGNTYPVYFNFEWFGFGDAFVCGDRVVFNENKEIIALESSYAGRYELSDSIPQPEEVE